MKHSNVKPNMRVLSFFMAVLMLMLTFTQGIVDVSLTVYAGTQQDGIIRPIPDKSKLVGPNTSNPDDDDAYVYTGNIKPVAISLYDYMTDYEITHGWNCMNDSNNPDPAYTYYNRYNPYDKFNKKISEMSYNPGTVSVQLDGSTTIIFKMAGGDDAAYIYYWGNGTSCGDFPGKRMSYIGWEGGKGVDNNYHGYNVFYYTFRSDENLPTGFILSRGDSSHKTQDITETLQRNYVYTFQYDDVNNLWNGANKRSSEAYNSDNKRSRLYLGNFLARRSKNPTSDPHASNPNGTITTYGGESDNPFDYTNDAKYNISPTLNSGKYNDFYWQANIAQRPVKIWDSEQNKNVQQKDRPYAAIQGLVDSTLTNGQITQGGTALPYFTSAWANESNPVMRAWESTAAEPIAFPFYEVLRIADNNLVGYIPGSNTDVTHKAKYYEFNSLDVNLQFQESTKTFRESGQQIEAATGTVGFFPFNNRSTGGSDGAHGNTNNYGFGAKFQMNFKLSSDGTTETVDENGNKIETGAGKVHTRFDFSGDDDLWVFIDNQLVLDIGGSHARVTGYVDFAERVAVVDKAVTYGTGGVDNLNIDGESKSIDISGIMGYNEGTGGYDENTVHTMTIFYMERGMAESNLLIRFNFPPESIYSKMKVKEQTDFSNVNTGLKNLTQKAAEKDVFQYYVENNGTTTADVLKENSYYGTTDSYIRNVQDIKTKLTPITNSASPKYFVPTGGDNYEPVKNTAYNWVDEYAIKSGTSEKMSSSQNIGNITDSSGYMYLMHGIPPNGGESEVKSSGEFEGQFKRYSMMRVTQSDTLYMPSAQDGTTVASLTGTYIPSGTTLIRKISNYYNPKRNYIFSTISSEYDITPGSGFTFRNDVGSASPTDTNEKTPVAMTVQFVNEPKVGTLIVKKNVKVSFDPNQPNDAISEDYKGEFTFKITLSDIFGIAGISPDATTNKYSNIVVKRISPDGSTTYPLYKLTDSDTGGYHGEFKLKANELLIIDQIPVQTKYQIVEDNTNTPNYDDSYKSQYDSIIVEGRLNENGADFISYVDTNGNGQYDQDEAASSNNAFIVNTHITKGLVLQKTITASNVINPADIPNQEFTFRVNLTIPSEVDMTNYPLTRSDNDQTVTIETDATTEVKYFDVTIQGGSTVTINGLPKGVGYTVSEINIPANWKITSSSGLTGTISDTNNVNITNEYTKPPDPVIKLTKVDITDNNALITESPAQFKLLKLKKTDSSNNARDWTNAATLSQFNAFINGDSYTPAVDTEWVEAVYPSDSTNFSTTDGVLTINEISAGNPFTPGDVYFFYEVTPPAGYEKDNTVTSSKVITLVRGDNFVTFPNSPAPLKMSVKKVDKDDTTKGLPGAEFELWIHDVIKTYSVETYANGTVESVPQPVANNPDPLPVLYQTDANKSVSYEWQEATDDKDYYYIKFNNTLGWSNVTMYIYNTESTVVSITAEKTSGNIYYFKNTSDATKIYFSNGTNRTIDIDISSLITDTTIYPNAKHGYGYTFRPANDTEFKDPANTPHQTDADGKYMVQIKTPAATNSNKVSVTEWNSTTSGGYADWIWFYYGTDGNGNMSAVYYNNSGSSNVMEHKGRYSVKINGVTHYFYKFEYKSGYNKIMFYNQHNNNLFAIVPQTLSTDMKGKVYSKGDYNNQNINNHPPDNSSINIGGGFADHTVGVFKCKDSTGLYANATYFNDPNSSSFNMGTTTYSVKTISYPTQPVSPSETHDNYSVKYQPEDRYELISDISGSSDNNNFITIDTAMNDPYIMFYDSNNNTILEETDNTKPVATSGMKLSVADKDGSNGAPYKIRLPKNAYSFVVSSGPKQTPNTTYKINLYDNGYHHAGSTFFVKAVINLTGYQNDPDYGKPTGDGQLDTSKPGNGIVRRIGYTATAGTYPIKPKTDADYIFFKDNSNAFTGGSYVCAYYYGDVDGEYKPWPGVPAQRSYVDNDGKTVYVFRPPAADKGKYKKVMFNDGTAASDRKITTAQDITLGTVYTTGSAASPKYGEQTTTPYTVTTSQKGTTSTTAYTIGTDYIYFENNGTSTFNTGYVTSGRYKFDDIHFEFFADAAGSVPVGTTSPGYIPDKIADTDVYKIAVPDGAAYFRVNNGEKAAVTDSNATVNNTRQSEIFKITPNGLYKFVEDTDAQKVWSNEAASSIAELDDHPYKIKDDFTATGTYIKLATVVTGETIGHEGEQEYIKANSLKRKGTEGADANTVDDEYLSHTVADEGPTAGSGIGIKVVKVKKQATITSTENITIANDANNDGTPDNDTYDKVYYYWKETVAPAGYKLPDSGEEYTIVDTTTTEAGHHYDSTDSVYRPTVKDESIAGGKVTLTKTAKEKVGTTDIGDTLAGAEFKLVKLLADGTEDTAAVVKFNQDTANTDGSYTASSSGTFNSDNNTPADPSDDKWLVTGSDGKLVLNNVPIGSYYLEEMKAPKGYSNLESDGTTNKKVYFSVGKIGDVVPDKEITMADEMAPAYIKLYEHINEKLDAWGDPTFVFKITQTQYYDSGGQLQSTAGKTQLVALTVDDTDVYSAGLTLHSNPDYNYQQWLEESTTEAEYKGMYHIDGQGRIRLEPGTYQISRIPVSRYQFVENTYCMQDDADHSASYTTHKTANEVLTVTVPVSKTAIVHYYDKVDYYDKFSQVDTKVNKFYTLDSSTKDNRTIKGIRLEDYHQAGSGTPNPPSFIPDTTGTNLQVSTNRLKAYFIYADGSEAEITDKNNLSISYVSDDNKVNGTGVDFDDFSYDTENHKMKVENANDHASERYTLTATYTFTGTDPPLDLITKFDLVFKVAES